jgi:hypothetical protein
MNVNGRQTDLFRVRAGTGTASPESVTWNKVEYLGTSSTTSS